jgi:hypothetical protein
MFEDAKLTLFVVGESSSNPVECGGKLDVRIRFMLPDGIHLESRKRSESSPETDAALFQ